MAVTHDATAKNTGSSVSTLSVALTIASNTNKYLIVHISASNAGAGATITSVKWNTTESLTQLYTASQGNDQIWAFGLKNPTAGSFNVDIVMGGVNNLLFAAASSFYNVDQTTPTGTGRTNSGTSGNDMWAATDDGTSGGVCVGVACRDVTATGTVSIAGKDGIPKYVAAGSLAAASGVTSRAPALPSGTLRGDLILAACSSENNATHSCSTTGWNKIGQTNSGANWTQSLWWAIQTTAGLSAPSITWTGSADADAQTWAYRDAKGSGTPVLTIGTVGTGSGTTHTSTGGNTTQNDSEVVYVDTCNANTAAGTPAGWTERNDGGSATGPCRVVFGDKDVATSGTGSGNISITAGNAAWVQQQLEVLHALNGDQTELIEHEGLGGFTCYNVAYESADTYNALGWTGTGQTTEEWLAGAIVLMPTAGATAYTATLSPVSFTFTPASLAAKTNRLVTLSPASYSFSLSALTNVLSRKATLSPAAFAFSLANLSVMTARKASLSAVSFSFTPSSLSAKTGRNAVLSPTSFSFTPSSLSAKTGRNAVLSPVAFAFALNDLEVVYTPGSGGSPIHYSVVLSPVAFSFTVNALTVDYSAGSPPSTPAPDTAPSGGGGGAYRRRYRRDIRDAIRRAVAELSGARTLRAKREASRRVATTIKKAADFVPPPFFLFSFAPELPLLEPIRLRLLELSVQLLSKEIADKQDADRLEQLMKDYDYEIQRLDAQDDDEAIAITLSLI